MDDQTFQDKIISERIAVLLGGSDEEHREQELMKDFDSVFEGLDHQTEQKIRTQINLMINKMIEAEKTAYCAGVKDGIRLIKWIQQL